MKCGYNALLFDINKIINYKMKNEGNINNKIPTRGGNSKNNYNFPPKKINFNQIKNNNKIISGNDSNNKSSNSRMKPKSKHLYLDLNNENKKKKNNNHRTNKNSIAASKLSKLGKRIKKNSTLSNIINKIFYNDYEKNTFSYNNAILNDRRTCCQYYLSLIKTKHPILFAFGPIKDYNSRVIKICILFLFFSFCYAINFSFVDEEMIHKIYEEYGGYKIMHYISYISISFAGAHILYIIMKLIFLPERNISEIRQKSSLYLANETAKKSKTCLKIKYFIFFLLGLVFLLIFWYVMSSFGAVYQNTQIYIFENALISFAISLIYPFFINIFPCIFRIPAIYSKNKNRGCMYNFGLILQYL